ncbi:hypothetical protein D3C74_193970 [compost metagenome]
MREVQKLDSSIKRVLHIISITSSYMIVLGVFWLIQIYTIGMVPVVKKITIYGVPIYFFISLLVAVFLVNKFIKISSPYK